MSIKNSMNVVCPNCNKEFEVTYWDSINGDLNPDEKEKLMNGALFMVQCKHCNCSTELVYPVLYHDMKNRAMIWFVPDADKKQEIVDTVEFAKAQLESFAKDDMNYKFRFVFDHDDLREKAIIINENLDDRFIEIIKLFIEFQIINEHKDIEVKKIYFNVTDDGEYMFEIYTKDKQVMTTIISEKFYSSIVFEFAHRVEKLSKDNYVFDMDWALKLFEK